MKTPKLILTIGAFAAFTLTAAAQESGVYQILTGGINVLPAMSTNVVVTYGGTNIYNAPNGATVVTNLLTMTVSEYNDVGLTWAFTGTATSTNGLNIFASYDGGSTYGAKPAFSYANLAPGAASYITNADLSVAGVTHLAFVLNSPGTTPATNMLLEVNLKSPKFGAFPATR